MRATRNRAPSTSSVRHGDGEGRSENSYSTTCEADCRIEVMDGSVRRSAERLTVAAMSERSTGSRERAAVMVSGGGGESQE